MQQNKFNFINVMQNKRYIARWINSSISFSCNISNNIPNFQVSHNYSTYDANNKIDSDQDYVLGITWYCFTTQKDRTSERGEHILRQFLLLHKKFG